MDIEDEGVDSETQELCETVKASCILEFRVLNDNLASVRLGSKWAIIDRAFRIISRKDYDNIGRMTNNMIIAKKDNKFTFINDRGEEICPPYDNVWAFDKGLALVQNKARMFFIDEEGNRHGDVFDYICRYGDSRIIITKGSAIEVFDTEEELQPFQYWLGDCAIIMSENKQGVINRKGNIVVPPEYDLVSIDQKRPSNYIPVSRNGKWGYVDKRTGLEVTEIIYDSMCKYTPLTSRTKLSIDGKFGIIDKKGKQLCPFIYDQIGNFIDGFAVVRIGIKFGYIRYSDCTEVDEIRYISAYPFVFGYGEVSLKGIVGTKKRYIDKDGKIYRKRPKRA